jgi:hypothetical protein
MFILTKASTVEPSQITFQGSFSFLQHEFRWEINPSFKATFSALLFEVTVQKLAVNLL